nr:MAG TPA: hypothetical protein [Caudoviricetes sp.]
MDTFYKRKGDIPFLFSSRSNKCKLQKEGVNTWH